MAGLLSSGWEVRRGAALDGKLIGVGIARRPCRRASSANVAGAGLRVVGTIPFSVVGVLASLTTPLAEAGISVFAVWTFDTDYLLVKEQDLARAADVLRRQGHAIRQE
jgi:hypothetical protein